MTARSNTAPTWIDRKETSDWAARLGKTARLVVDAMRDGYDAEYEYNKMVRHGVQPQAAIAAVQKRLDR